MLETHTFVVLIFVCLVFLGGGLCLFAGVKGFVSARWGEGSLFWSHGSVYCMLESWFCLLHAGVRISLPSTCWSPSSVSAHWGQGSLVWSLFISHQSQGSVYCSLESGFCLLLTRVRVLFIAR